jgi:hypothetical protein
MVDWQFTMVFRATAGGTRITILAAAIPFTPLASIYKTPDVDNPLFVAFVNNGTNRTQALCGFTSTGDFFIDVPSGGDFNDTSNSNVVSFSIRVRRA